MPTFMIFHLFLRRMDDHRVIQSKNSKYHPMPGCSLFALVANSQAIIKQLASKLSDFFSIGTPHNSGCLSQAKWPKLYPISMHGSAILLYRIQKANPQKLAGHSPRHQKSGARKWSLIRPRKHARYIKHSI